MRRVSVSLRRLAAGAAGGPRPCRCALSSTATFAEEPAGPALNMDHFYDMADTGLVPAQDMERGLEELFGRLKKRCVLKRAPALRIVDALANFSPEAPVTERLFVLSSDGSRGTGKTTALLHVVHWARANGWVVMHVPRGRDIGTGGLYVKPCADEPGTFDQPHLARDLLQALMAVHQSQLAALDIQNEVGPSSLPRPLYGSSLARPTAPVAAWSLRGLLTAQACASARSWDSGTASAPSQISRATA